MLHVHPELLLYEHFFLNFFMCFIRCFIHMIWIVLLRQCDSSHRTGELSHIWKLNELISKIGTATHDPMLKGQKSQ